MRLRNVGLPVQVLAQGYLCGLDWRGLAAPKGTPADVTQTLRAGFLKMAEDPDFIRLMDELALPRALLDGEKFGEFLAGMEKTMEPALKEANLLKKD